LAIIICPSVSSFHTDKGTWNPDGKIENVGIQNINEQHLTSYPSDSEVCFKGITGIDPGYCDYTFTKYNNTEDSPLSVAITFRSVLRKTYTLCSQGDGSLGLMEGELPDKIEGTICPYIFHMSKFAAGDGSYLFQCADGSGQYLSYNEHNQAVLKDAPDVSEDNTCKMTVIHEQM
uniref:Uncharacterized protein n=1 Tax=Xenopus tropicalis TaxID=8364 RepID=A0A6I8Q4A0_XENTR